MAIAYDSRLERLYGCKEKAAEGPQTGMEKPGKRPLMPLFIS